MDSLATSTAAPSPKMPRKISPAQRLALIGLRDHGTARYGLRGRCASGGFTATSGWIERNGLHQDLAGKPALSPRGRRVLTAGRLVP